MRVLAAGATIAVMAFVWDAARAYPDGAPWGAANPAAEQNCATCHFDDEPLRDSEMLVIRGLPEQPAPGAQYELEVVFADPNAVVAGFQLVAQAVEQQAGAFASSAANIEFIGSAIRSTAPARNDGGISWVLEWRVPLEIESPIVFHVAATAANDDGSPFGDTVHFRSYTLSME